MQGTLRRLGAALLASMLAAAAFAAPAERVYLKREGKKWRRVTRAVDGRRLLKIEGDAAAPASATSVSAQSTGFFQPYVAYPVGSWPEAVAVADLNGDGRNDVALVTSFYFDAANDYMLHVFTQGPTGELTRTARYAVGGNPQSVDVGDLNGDGRADVVVGNNSAVVVLLQNAGGTLDVQPALATPHSHKVRVGDLNGDGRDDVAGLDWGTTVVAVFLQDASGRLGSAATYTAAHGGYDDLEIGDVNGDGFQDIVVMSGQLYAYDNLAVLLQQPGAGFAPVRYYDVGGDVNASGVGVGDVNADSLNDVVVSYGGNSPSSRVAVFPQQGGILGAPQALPSYDIPEPVEVGDVNGDAIPDVVVLHGGWVRAGVYPGASAGALGAEQLFPIPYASHYNPHGLAVGDVTGDGRNDVVIADYNSGLVILRQNPPSDTQPPQVAVTAPRGAALQVGVPYEIEWTAGDDGSGLARFDVAFSSGPGQPFTPIAGCTGLGPSARRCRWTPGPPATTEGVVRVDAADGAGNRAAATGTYTLQFSTITVTAPSAPARWGIGSRQTITWVDDLPAGEVVDVAVSRDGGATWSALASGLPNTGRFEWTVDGAAAEAAVFRVSWPTYPAEVFDVSDAGVRIEAAFIQVLAPNAPGTWYIGTTRTIEWQHNLGTSGVVVIAISRDDGWSWTPIAVVANDGAETGRYAWTVTGPKTPKARIRVTWTANGAVSDRSDARLMIH